ncbi:MAG TPA: response regulator, partial [Allocoleopsis sp.]
ADYKQFPLVYMLQKRIVEVANNYKKQPALNDRDKNWIAKAKQILEQKNVVNVLEEEIELEILPETSEDEALLLAQIWGQTPREEVTLVAPIEIEIEGKKEQELTGGTLQISQEENPQVSKYFQTQEAEIVEEETENQTKTKAENTQSRPAIIKQSVRVDLEELQRLNYLTGNLLINQNRQILQDEQVQESVEKLRSLIQKHQQTLNQLREWSNLMSTQPDYQRSLVMNQQPFCVIDNYGNQGVKQPQFDWLEFDNYTEVYNLFNLALEETIQLTSLTDTIEQIAKQLSYTLEKQQRLLSHVRDDLTSVQMSPLGDILNRFIPMIEQLSNSKNKPVELKISGGQVLVDKAIAEKLYDPLLHLVRNAFDHGIETEEIREQRRKPIKGKIEIRAYHLGNHTIIEIKDDGEGLDFESIKRKAVEKNFVSANQVEQLSKSQLLDLLFEPGFSTAKTLSDISGRGIGLDIVKNQLQSLKGSIRVESQPFMGTTFMLKIPFSLTSAKFFVCQGGNATYALLSESIMKIVLPLPGQIQEFEGKKVLQYGAETDMSLVPVYKLSELIKYNDLYIKNHPYFLHSKELPTTSRLANLFLLKGNGGLFALEIDQIIGEQELVIRPVGNAITAPSYIFGCSILGDGRLILAIDGAVLVEGANSPKSLPLLTENKVQILPGVSGNFLPEKTSLKAGDIVPVNSGSNIKKVLVIDDSMSHRQTLTLNLQKAGYEVYQAQDGLEGIEQLQKNPDTELVICDLEMPRMNGFEFLNQWRQDTKFAKTPVLILTSRNSEKHRMLALQLGAAAYFTKPYLEHDFLNKISDLLKE